MDYDPIMERNIKVTRSITDAMQPLYVLFNELKCQQKQLLITMFFKRSEKECVSAVDDSQPSTSSAIDIGQQLPASCPSPSSVSEESASDNLIVISSETSSGSATAKQGMT
ncbi:hypothetical protein M514_06212 [Trichuris suis]|uniref:Uncharacterized protein n=1 Tax=Trichuris suis TaxID=68888 RepID=A0A085N2M1_9BILA|nr:hypothetical protein M513_06212 [Trichuris suis]KFD63717.1 hypothetical protein M514_06212 [Trichuris suis]